MNISQIKQVAKECGSDSDNRHDERTTYEFDGVALQAFADAIIKAYVAEQKPTIWLTQKEFDTLKRAQKTDRETVQLYDLKGETE